MFKIMEIGLLRNHEEIKPDYLRKLADEIKSDGRVKIPITVENKHFVVLDGHHRVEALKLLGCRRIPVYLIDYFDDDITLTVWPGATVASVRKEEVIERGLSGKLFPPKTTRHIFKEKLKEVPVDLKDLY